MCKDFFYWKFFYEPLRISGCNFPHNVLKSVSAGSPCTFSTETMLRPSLTERKFGSSCSRSVFSSALVRVCLLPSAFAYLSKTAMVIPIAVSSWDMLLLESGFLLSRNSLRALSENGAWSSSEVLYATVPSNQWWPTSRTVIPWQTSVPEHCLHYTPLPWQLFKTQALSPWCGWYNQLLTSRNQPRLQNTQCD